MKKRLFLLLSFIMSVLMLASCTTEGGESSDTTDDDTTAEQVLTIFGDPNATFKIVRGEDCQDFERDAAIKIRSALCEITGTQIEIETDWDDKKVENPIHYDYEILVGETNREGNDIEATDVSELGLKDFIIRVQGTRVVIRARKGLGMELAAEEFIELFREQYEANSGVVELAYNYFYLEKNAVTYFDISDRTDLVGICYSTWFNPVYYYTDDTDGDGEIDPPNISLILAGEQDWGDLTAFHYWGKPALGYYASDDKEVIRTHMTQLAEAGVDYIIIDNTNVSTGWMNASYGDTTYWDEMVDAPFQAIIETMLEMRKEGLVTPYIVQWCSTGEDWAVIDEIYNKYYTVEEYSDLWVYWDGKPFFLTTGKPTEDNDKITWRYQWGLQQTSIGEWSFLQKNNTPNYDADGNVEQMCVCVAMQADYMSNKSSATGRNGGRTFQSQWQNAFKYHPKCITITWWNEWIAQRFEGNKFVDNYNEEYSRDIEPMEGGHGDSYYQWMCEYIRAYKAGEECPDNLIESEN